jgi:DNA-binding IclR family transcriptional regulator
LSICSNEWNFMSVLRNAAAVLRLFTAERPDIGVMEVAEVTGLPKSTTSRLMRMMAEEGLLEAAGLTRRYRPGTLVVAAARLFRSGSELVAAMEALVTRVVSECGHTGFVSVRDGSDIFAIKTIPGTQVLRVVTPIGQRYPASATAVGRALLARLSEDEIRTLIDTLPQPSPSAPATFEELFTRITRVHTEGVAEANDEANRGVGSIAIAIADHGAGEAVAGCISFSLSAVTEAERRLIRRCLFDGAVALGERFADPFWLGRPDIDDAMPNAA